MKNNWLNSNELKIPATEFDDFDFDLIHYYNDQYVENEVYYMSSNIGWITSVNLYHTNILEGSLFGSIWSDDVTRVGNFRVEASGMVDFVSIEEEGKARPTCGRFNHKSGLFEIEWIDCIESNWICCSYEYDFAENAKDDTLKRELYKVFTK